jgi:hypothetical protein
LDCQLQIEDYFDEDEYEGLREEERNPLINNLGIDLNSLQDALMEIDQEMEDQPSSLNATNTFSTEDLSTIRRIIRCTTLPSWLNRPPLLFGDASAGKVRSADWVTFLAIFMPFAIVHGITEEQRK